jgi:hypothetical protein
MLARWHRARIGLASRSRSARQAARTSPPSGSVADAGHVRAGEHQMRIRPRLSQVGAGGGQHAGHVFEPVPAADLDKPAAGCAQVRDTAAGEVERADDVDVD